MIANMLLFMGLGKREAILIAIVVLLFFGGIIVSEIIKRFCKGGKSFKDAQSGIDENYKK